jgi:phage protein U
MFAQLGSYQFDRLKSPTSFNESFAMRYARIPRINRKDDLQGTGEELAEVELAVTYASDFCDPATEIKALEASALAREINTLIMGDGTIIGDFVITAINKTYERLSPTGALESAQIGVSLLEKVTDREPVPVGAAMASQNPAPQPPLPQPPSPAASIMADIQEGRNEVSRIERIGAKIEQGTSGYKKGIGDIREAADDAAAAYSSAKNRVDATEKIVDRAKDLPTSLGEILPYLESLAQVDYLTDTSTLKNHIDQAVKSADKITAHAAPVAGFNATREGGE